MTTKGHSKLFKIRGITPLLAFAFIILLTSLSTVFVITGSRDKERVAFEATAERTLAAIEARVETYLALLRSGAGLVAAHEELEPSEFQAFTNQIFISRRYSGIQGIGLTLRVPSSEKERFESEMAQKLERKDFHIWPSYAREEYFAIVYLEPLERRNQAAIGFDMFTETTRHNAMSEARDTGQPIASGKVILVQEIDEKKQAGFLIYHPLYRGGKTPGSVEERRRLLLGFIYAPFRMDDLLRGIFGDQDEPLLSLEIFDGKSTAPESLMHRSPAVHAKAPFEDLLALTETRELVLEGHSWTVAFHSNPQLFSTANLAALLILFLGSATGLALFLFLRSEMLARTQAEKMTDKLRQSQETLHESENRFRRLVEQAPLSIQVCDPDGQSLLVNPAWEALWEEENPAGNVFDYRLLAEAGVLPDIRRAFQGEVVDLPALRVKGKEEVFWVRTHVYPVRNHRGSIRQIVLIHEDITARKKLEEELAQRAERLAETNRIKDNFISTLSHELRTPLSAILGWLSLARSGALDAGSFEQALEIVERNGKSLAQLIDDLLDVSRIMSGKIKLEVKELDLGNLVEASLESQRSALDAKELSLEFERSPEKVLLVGDEIRLQQVVWNLLTNAIKFTPRGGSIRVSLHRRESHLELAVADNGQGIEPDFIPKMFEVFRQADSSITRGQGGLGLGLAIVKSLVELHGGTIMAQSEGPGKGATFVVRFPIRAIRKPEEPSRKDDKPPLPPESLPVFRATTSLRGLRILCVDDEKDARDLVRRVLEIAGAQVVTAASAEEALQVLRAPEKLPDVILCDIGMPGEDGYSLIRKIRLLPPERGGTTPAAALTAFARQEDVQAALEAGFQRHLAKPVAPEELLKTVAQLAGGILGEATLSSKTEPSPST